MSRTTTAQTTVEAPSQTLLLIGMLEALLAEAKANPAVKVFASKNTGVYASQRVKAPDARALGILVPLGGAVSLSIQAVVVDPANKKDA